MELVLQKSIIPINAYHLVFNEQNGNKTNKVEGNKLKHLLLHIVVIVWVLSPIKGAYAVTGVLASDVVIAKAFSNEIPQDQAPSETKRVLRIGYDHQPPWRYSDKNGKAIGIDVVRISAILDSAGIAYEFYGHPWKRILRYIETGEIDLALAAAKLPDRQEYALFSNEVFKRANNYLFVKNEYVDMFTGFNSLSMLTSLPVKIAVRRGASYSDEYELLLSTSEFSDKLINASDTAQSINLTLFERAVGFISTHEIANFELQQACMPNVFTPVYNLTAKEDTATFIMLSKKTADIALRDKIDQAMRDVDSASSKYEAMFTPVFPPCG